MNYYFQIQYRRVFRHIQDFGVNPIVGIIVIGVFFIGLSLGLFQLIPDYAPYIYLFLATNVLFSLSNVNNREFLKLSFTKKEFRKLRQLENLIVSLPFLIILVLKLEVVYAVVLLLMALLLAFIELNQSFSISFKTPFSKHPFEYSRGFRKSILVYPIVYLVTAIGIAVGNMNLGIFAILLIGLSSAHFYSFTEPDYYVWVYREGAKKMLQQKMKSGVINLTLSVSPLVLSLLVFFPEGILYPILALVLMILFLMANVVLKYAHFPRNIEVIQAILLPLLFLFPPLLLAIISYYYGKAIQQLNPLTKP